VRHFTCYVNLTLNSAKNYLLIHNVTRLLALSVFIAATNSWQRWLGWNAGSKNA